LKELLLNLRILYKLMARVVRMKNAEELIPTRQSLLSRLKDWSDQESWKLFFDTYWRLIYNTALRAGLTDAEAQDVVQETVISVLKSMRTFKYDSASGSFKGWLLRATGWRITDQFRKRQRGIDQQNSESPADEGTATIDRVPDPAGLALEVAWDEEWDKNLMEAATDRIKRRVDPKQYQIFDLHVFKGWSVSKVARTLNVNPGRVYLAKHRITHLIKKEIHYLQTKPL
jgi:RNA polymerase sigma-70 factor (ECF subfamily)